MDSEITVKFSKIIVFGLEIQIGSFETPILLFSCIFDKRFSKIGLSKIADRNLYARLFFDRTRTPSQKICAPPHPLSRKTEVGTG